MQNRYELIAFDIDGTLCQSGRTLTPEQLELITLSDPESFREQDKSGFNYSAFPGVVDTIKALAGVRRGIISNGFGRRQRNKLILTGLDDLFDPIYISEDFACSFFEEAYTADRKKEFEREIEKPSPIMMMRMNLMTRTLASRSLYVGNTDEDHRTARASGWDFLRIRDPDPKYSAIGVDGAIAVIDQNRFHEILEYI